MIETTDSLISIAPDPRLHPCRCWAHRVTTPRYFFRSSHRAPLLALVSAALFLCIIVLSLRPSPETNLSIYFFSFLCCRLLFLLWFDSALVCVRVCVWLWECVEWVWGLGMGMGRGWVWILGWIGNEKCL